MTLKELYDSLKAKPKVVYLPRTQSFYKDTSYEAWVSGMQPQLDSIRVFRKTVVKTVTVTNTVEVKRESKPFGIGVQAGYVFNGNKLTPYTKIGISYSL